MPIDFEANERFSNLPLQERATLVLVTTGKAILMLNSDTVSIAAPCVLLLSQYDTVRLLDENRLAAKSFSFVPKFLNSSLSFESLKANEFVELEDEHDRNMMMLFLKRDGYFSGIMDLPPNTYLRISEWLAIMGTEVFAQSDGRWTCRIRRYLLQTLYLLDDIYANRKIPGSIRRDKSPIDILLEYMHINYPNDISLDTLCGLVRLNRTTLNRMFKKQVGCTAIDYLQRHRIKIACVSLTHTNLTIAEIAVATGFNSDTYFIKKFTAIMGESPTEFRHKSWAALGGADEALRYRRR